MPSKDHLIFSMPSSEQRREEFDKIADELDDYYTALIGRSISREVAMALVVSYQECLLKRLEGAASD